MYSVQPYMCPCVFKVTLGGIPSGKRPTSRVFCGPQSAGLRQSCCQTMGLELPEER